MDRFPAYIDYVINDGTGVGRLERLAVERHLSDIERIGNEDFPYIFSNFYAKKIIFFAEIVRHWKGPKAGQRIVLEAHQVFYLGSLFGWIHKDTKLRRFTSSYKEVARKNAKTTEAAIKALYHMGFDGESGAQVYFTATKYDQAKLGFNDMQKFIDNTPELISVFKNWQSTTTGPFFSSAKALGADSKTQDGTDPSWAVVDEYHAHPNDSMLNIMESGMGTRLQPMIDVITTAGYNKQSACFRLRKIIIDILEGKIINDRMFGIIFSMDEDDDWLDPTNWAKANPNMDVSVLQEFIKDRIKKAINEGGSKAVDVKTKTLNQWTDAAKVWIPNAIWQTNHHGINIDSLRGQRCYGGLDLASGIDLNAFTLFFPDTKAVLLWCFMPEARVKDNPDRVDYQKWVDDGYIIATPGMVMDHTFLVEKILELALEYDILSTAIDKYMAYHGTVQGLLSQGLNLTEMRQGFLTLSAPTKELERLASSGELEHFNNPVLSWMIGNVEISTDSAGNIKPDKGKSINKIDGVAALVNSIGEWQTLESESNNQRSMYDSPRSGAFDNATTSDNEADGEEKEESIGLFII